MIEAGVRKNRVELTALIRISKAHQVYNNVICRAQTVEAFAELGKIRLARMFLPSE